MDIIEKIKKKKELAGLDNKFVEEELKKHLPNRKISEKEEKIIIKQVRAELRKYTGRFQNTKNRNNLNKEELLKSHSSTRERLPYYDQVKKEIYKLKPKSILDLGCGLNPIAIAKPNLFYYASDIKQDELNLIKNYFQKNNIQGKTFTHDLRKVTKLPKTDISLILKVFDVIERKGHKLAEEIIKSLNSKYIIVSFSTKTLSEAPMRHPQRGWIEQLLKRLNLKYKTFKIPNEIFYIIQRKP